MFVAFVKDNDTMSSIRNFEDHIRVSYFVQNRRKETILKSFLYDTRIYN